MVPFGLWSRPCLFRYNIRRHRLKTAAWPGGNTLVRGKKWSFRPVAAGRTIIYNDKQTGARARKARLTAGLTQGQIARRMKISIGYVSDLELGENRWTESLVERYIRALNR